MITRPKVSYILVGYQHGAFVREAALSALAQDYPDIEFIFSDDSSSDDTYAIMQEIAEAGRQAGQSVAVSRTSSNFGLSRHLASLCVRATGEIFVFQAADDIARPNRVTELVKTFTTEPTARMVMSNVSVIDNTGGVIRPVYAPAGTIYSADMTILLRTNFPWLVGASEAIRREVFTEFGPFFFTTCWEDYAFAFRAALTGRILFCDQILLSWRHHHGNMSHFRDFTGTPESRARFAGHFLKNIRARIVYRKQQLIDLEKVVNRLPVAAAEEIRRLLLAGIDEARLEHAARSGARWKLLGALLRKGIRVKSSFPWLFRQVAIRACHNLYFRVLYDRLRSLVRKESHQPSN
jgi:GT2 family glycosyltransferase